MSAATLTRTRLVRLPATATWPTPARPATTLPCENRDPNWWDTGHPRSQDAIRLCRTCPLAGKCAPDNPLDAAGTIRDGIAYDDHGRPADLCNECGTPRIRRHGSPICVNGHGTVASHHQQIAAMRNRRLSYTQIGEALGISASAINRYWVQHLNRTGVRNVRLDRLPGIAADTTTNRPQDYHDHVIRLLSDLDAAYTYEEVAYAIGSTTDCVKGYWRRHQQHLARLGLPTVNRRSVSTRGGHRHLRPGHRHAARRMETAA